MKGHRSAIKKGGQSLFHRHFHQPDHSVDDMSANPLEDLPQFEKSNPAYHNSQNKRTVPDQGAWYSQTVWLQ